MLEGITLYSTQYYENNVFKGSYRGINFRLEKSGEGDNLVLRATAWKGPFIYEKTKEEKFAKEFEFSEEGIKMAGEWLSGQPERICGGQERRQV